MMAANSNVLLARRAQESSKTNVKRIKIVKDHGLCEQLINLYDVSICRQKRNERVIRDCRDLLKPWPRKKEVQPVGDTSSVKASSDNAGTTESASKNDTVPAAERAALELAEKALAQAQRFIQRQAKVIERESKSHQESMLPAQEKSISEQRKSVSGATQKEFNVDNASKFSNGLSNKATVPKPAKSGVPPKTSSAGQRSTRAPGLRSAAPLAQGQQGQTKTLTERSGSGRQLGSTQTVNGDAGIISQSTLKKALAQNVSSSNSNNRAAMASARTGHRPAHMAAPFKTQAPAPRVKNRATRTSVLRQGSGTGQQRTGVSSSSQITARQDRGQSGRTQTAFTQRSRADTMSVYDDEVMSQMTAESLSISSHEKDASPQPQMHWMTEEELEQEMSSSVGPLSACEQLDGDCDEIEPPAEPPAFELLSDGQKLTLPPKLRKAMAVNNKLRHQLETAALTFHASRDNSPTSSFLNKLTEYYDAKTSEEYKTTVQMLALYKRLTTLMEKLYKKKLNGGSTWQEVLRTKRTMENVCLLYADMEEGYCHRVQGSEEDFGKSNPTLTIPDIQPAAIWLPSHILQHDSLSLRPALRYRKLQDAERYMSLVHKAQLQMLNLYIIDLVADTMLPLLEKMDGSHSSFRPIYRAVYSLLCESARRQPIIISDIPDADSS